MRADQVKRQVEEAFADVPYPGDDLIAYDKDAWECPRLNADFRGYHWRDVPRGVVGSHADDLALLSPAGFHFYLPAFVLASFDDSEVRGWLRSHLAVGAREPSNLEKYERFTPAQKNAVRAFLEFMREQDGDELTWQLWSEPLDKYWGQDWA